MQSDNFDFLCGEISERISDWQKEARKDKIRDIAREARQNALNRVHPVQYKLGSLMIVWGRRLTGQIE